MPSTTPSSSAARSSGCRRCRPPITSRCWQTETTPFPKPPKKMPTPIPRPALDATGKLTDDTKKVIDLIAEADIILAGGHLPASELHILFEEAARRGVKKMM